MSCECDSEPCNPTFRHPTRQARVMKRGVKEVTRECPRPPTPPLALGGIVAENIGPLALYYESTLKAGRYENRAMLKLRYENRGPSLGLRRLEVERYFQTAELL